MRQLGARLHPPPQRVAFEGEQLCFCSVDAAIELGILAVRAPLRDLAGRRGAHGHDVHEPGEEPPGHSRRGSACRCVEREHRGGGLSVTLEPRDHGAGAHCLAFPVREEVEELAPVDPKLEHRLARELTGVEQYGRGQHAIGRRRLDLARPLGRAHGAREEVGDRHRPARAPCEGALARLPHVQNDPDAVWLGHLAVSLADEGEGGEAEARDSLVVEGGP